MVRRTSRMLTADNDRPQRDANRTDRTARRWDVESGVAVLAVPGGGFTPFSPDGSRIVTSGLDHGTAVSYDGR